MVVGSNYTFELHVITARSEDLIQKSVKDTINLEVNASDRGELMNQSFSLRMEERINSKSLLTHPFYQAWQNGELTINDLRHYAQQYYFFEAAFPMFLSSIHSKCQDRMVRQSILENLWDEEYGDNNHRALWLAFCAGLGLSEEAVVNAEVNKETQALIDTYQDISGLGSFQEGLAAMYAYEFQVPAISITKIEGLLAYYGFKKGDSLRFFDEHSTLDEEHAKREAESIIKHTSVEFETTVEKALDKALDAWWGFLDGINEERFSRATAAD